MNKIINDIIRQQKTVYFISPHLDDAILSSGDLIAYLAPRTPVVVVNVFSKIHHHPATFSAKRFVSLCGYSSPTKLSVDRVIEDDQIFKKIGVRKINLDFIDGMWRRKNNLSPLMSTLGKIIPELVHLYPTYRFHLNQRQIAPPDYQLIKTIYSSLEKIITPNSLVFCPLSVGNHIDHLIVRQVCEKLPHPLFYWTDYPYILDAKNANSPDIDYPNQTFSFQNNLSQKKSLIKGYRTQIKMLFGQNKLIKLLPEKYYFGSKHFDQTTISIGIPAYNEQENIGYLLDDLLSQHLSHLSLRQILVYSDGSQDNTENIVSQYSAIHPQIKLISGSKRQGIGHGLNRLFKNMDSDIGIILNADIRINDKDFIKKITQPIVRLGIDLTSCPIVSIKTKGLIEAVLRYGETVKNKIILNTNSRDHIYLCHGPARAFSRHLYHRLNFPHSFGDDMYSYLFAQQHHYRFLYVPNTEVLYRLPSNFKDYLHQGQRFRQSIKIMTEVFPPQFIKSQFHLPQSHSLLTILSQIILNPFYILSYLILVGLSQLNPLEKFKRGLIEGNWEIATSSKNLNHEA